MHRRSFITNDISKTGLCLRPQVKRLLNWAQSIRRQGLALSIGSSWVGFLPEDGDIVQSPNRRFY
jgi:hypothetical protein